MKCKFLFLTTSIILSKNLNMISCNIFDPIVELDNFSEDWVSIDVTIEIFLKSRCRNDSTQSPRFAKFHKESATWVEENHWSSNFDGFINKPESPWHGPAPSPPAQKVLRDEINPKWWSCVKQTESFTALIETCRGIFSWTSTNSLLPQLTCNRLTKLIDLNLYYQTKI